MEITQVISLIRDRDELGLSYLYDHYAAALNGIILRVVGCEKSAEEILQQTFLKVWDKIDLYNEEKSTLFTWMAAIARNSAIDLKRTKKYERNKDLESWDIKQHETTQTLESNAQIDTKKLLLLIKPKYRTVIDCIYLEGHSHREAAELLDIPLGTVKSRLRLGLGEMRQLLKSEKLLFISSLVTILYILLCL